MCWSVVGILCAAAVIRVGVAVAVDRWIEPAGFKVPDSQAYWDLGEALARGGAFSWGGRDGRGARLALRTPGYPLFIAAVTRIAGPSVLAVRIAQAVLNTGSCLAVYLLARRLVPAAGPGARLVPLLALVLMALDPYQWLFAALVLSESLFGLLLLGWLLIVARLPGRAPLLVATGAGMMAGLGTLVRPSWLLAAPLTALGLALAPLGRQPGPSWSCRRQRAAARPHPWSFPHRLMAAAAMVAGMVVVLAPWWVRNYRVTGHFVATTLFTGASLYDGLNPAATGASDQRFLARPPVRDLPEWEQDRELSRRAVAFARRHPGRVGRLMVRKFFRYWNLWPNDTQDVSWPIRLASLLVVGPMLILAALGGWIWRRRPGVLIVLLGPVCYFCAIHLIFVSSIRYREPAMPPLLVLSAVGLEWLASSPRTRRAQPSPQARPN